MCRWASDDGTREIVQRMAECDSRVRLLENPRRSPPAALNIAIQAARFELIARMDGHTDPSTDYLSQCIRLMKQTQADCVGGRWVYVAETYAAGAIIAALQSPFGTGTARWRFASQSEEVDTVPFGVWRRTRGISLGGFDETSYPNEDYEFHYKLRAAGGKIWYSPNIVTTYFARRGLFLLAKQYWKYGLGKARVFVLHPRSLRLRHTIAPLFVAGLVLGFLLSFLHSFLYLIYAIAIGVYLMLVLAFSLRQAAQYGWQFLPVIPLVSVLHLTWGSGFWIGLGRELAGNAWT
jgi:glycosyltransferase involved in cell wall biosynthesis